MTELPMNAFTGKSLLGIEYDGNNVLLRFAKENRIVIYSGLYLSITGSEKMVKSVEQSDGEIKLIFSDIEIKISIDKEIIESFVANIDGKLIVARD